MKKVIYFLMVVNLFSTFAFTKKMAALKELVHPFKLIINGDRMYISDGPTIFIHSLKDYTLIKKIGREGEGPQEFYLDRAGGNDQVDMFFCNDLLLVNSFGRISYFTKEGEYVKEIKILGTVGRWFGALKDKFIGRKFTRDETEVKYHQVLMYDSDFKPIKTIYQHEHSLNLRLNKKFNPLTIEQAEFKICDNKIFVMDSDRTRIMIYNEKGEKIVSIIPEPTMVSFTKEAKKEMIESFKYSPMWTRLYGAKKSLFLFPEFYPPIRNFYLDPGGKRIYIQGYYSDNEKIEYLVYDFKGKFIKKVMLFFKIQSRALFYKEKLYQLIENDETEEYELHVLEIN